ncbi:unnamed protein product [Gordionus sp. m RMFG-2023]
MTHPLEIPKPLLLKELYNKTPSITSSNLIEADPAQYSIMNTLTLPATLSATADNYVTLLLARVSQNQNKSGCKYVILRLTEDDGEIEYAKLLDNGFTAFTGHLRGETLPNVHVNNDNLRGSDTNTPKIYKPSNLPRSISSSFTIDKRCKSNLNISIQNSHHDLKRAKVDGVLSHHLETHFKEPYSSMQSSLASSVFNASHRGEGPQFVQQFETVLKDDEANFLESMIDSTDEAIDQNGYKNKDDMDGSKKNYDLFKELSRPTMCMKPIWESEILDNVANSQECLSPFFLTGPNYESRKYLCFLQPSNHLTLIDVNKQLEDLMYKDKPSNITVPSAEYLFDIDRLGGISRQNDLCSPIPAHTAISLTELGLIAVAQAEPDQVNGGEIFNLVFYSGNDKLHTLAIPNSLRTDDSKPNDYDNNKNNCLQIFRAEKKESASTPFTNPKRTHVEAHDRRKISMSPIMANRNLDITFNDLSREVPSSLLLSLLNNEPLMDDFTKDDNQFSGLSNLLDLPNVISQMEHTRDTTQETSIDSRISKEFLEKALKRVTNPMESKRDSVTGNTRHKDSIHIVESANNSSNSEKTYLPHLKLLLYTPSSDLIMSFSKSPTIYDTSSKFYRLHIPPIYDVSSCKYLWDKLSDRNNDQRCQDIKFYAHVKKEWYKKRMESFFHSAHFTTDEKISSSKSQNYKLVASQFGSLIEHGLECLGVDGFDFEKLYTLLTTKKFGKESSSPDLINLSDEIITSVKRFRPGFPSTESCFNICFNPGLPLFANFYFSDKSPNSPKLNNEIVTKLRRNAWLLLEIYKEIYQEFKLNIFYVSSLATPMKYVCAILRAMLQKSSDIDRPLIECFHIQTPFPNAKNDDIPSKPSNHHFLLLQKLMKDLDLGKDPTTSLSQTTHITEAFLAYMIRHNSRSDKKQGKDTILSNATTSTLQPNINIPFPSDTRLEVADYLMDHSKLIPIWISKKEEARLIEENRLPFEMKKRLLRQWSRVLALPFAKGPLTLHTRRGPHLASLLNFSHLELFGSCHYLEQNSSKSDKRDAKNAGNKLVKLDSIGVVDILSRTQGDATFNLCEAENVTYYQGKKGGLVTDIYWPYFHNGVATALKFLPIASTAEKNTDDFFSELVNFWILYNKPPLHILHGSNSISDNSSKTDSEYERNSHAELNEYFERMIVGRSQESNEAEVVENDIEPEDDEDIGDESSEENETMDSRDSNIGRRRSKRKKREEEERKRWEKRKILSVTHAGVLLGLGLLGHMSYLSPFAMKDYLQSEEPASADTTKPRQQSNDNNSAGPNNAFRDNDGTQPTESRKTKMALLLGVAATLYRENRNHHSASDDSTAILLPNNSKRLDKSCVQRILALHSQAFLISHIQMDSQENDTSDGDGQSSNRNNFTDFSLPDEMVHCIEVQTAALYGQGMVRAFSCDTHVSLILAKEIGGYSIDNSCKNHSSKPSYSIAAALALGIINFNRARIEGDTPSTTLSKLQSILLNYVLCGCYRPLDKINYKMSRSDINLTFPSAALALALIYFRSNNISIVKYLCIPVTIKECLKIRPDFYMIKMITCWLIYFDQIQADEEWWNIFNPSQLDLKLSNKLRDLFIHEIDEEMLLNLLSRADPEFTFQDAQQLLHTKNFVRAGKSFALALKYAGTHDLNATEILYKEVERLSKNVQNYRSLRNLNQQMLNVSEDKIAYVALETCLNTSLISLAMVQSGSGDLKTFNYLRSCFDYCDYKIMLLETAESGTFTNEEKDLYYLNIPSFGHQYCVSTCISLLFMGHCKYTLSNDKPTSAACNGSSQGEETRKYSEICLLIASFYPFKWPAYVSDNRFHLQALRHFYVLCVKPNKSTVLERNLSQSESPITVSNEKNLPNLTISSSLCCKDKYTFFNDKSEFNFDLLIDMSRYQISKLKNMNSMQANDIIDTNRETLQMFYRYLLYVRKIGKTPGIEKDMKKLMNVMLIYNPEYNHILEHL